MKRWMAGCLLVLLLAGCASRGDRSAEAEAEEEPAALVYPRVEIFYQPDTQPVVIDGGGSSMSGLAGALGPVAALAALGAHVVSQVTAGDRVMARSTQFQAAVAPHGGAKLNEAYARELERVLRERERDVKLVPIAARPAGANPKKLSVPGMVVSPGYTALILRLTSGYGAPDLTSSYRPIVLVELQVQDDQGRYQTHNHFQSNYGGPTFFRYETLLKEHETAYDGLQAALFMTIPWVADAHFPTR